MTKKNFKSLTKGPTQRMLRVGEMVRHKLSELLSRGEVHDDVLASHVITISEVRMAPDLRLATAYIMPLGGKGAEVVIAALERHKKYIRAEIAHSLNLKFAPDVRFKFDDTFDEVSRIDALLHSERVRRDVEKK